MQATEVKNRLEKKIRTLEKEKIVLLEETKQLKELVELSRKAKHLEEEVDSLKNEVKTLRDKIPNEFLRELDENTYALLSDEESEEERGFDEECVNCEEEDLL